RRVSADAAAACIGWVAAANDLGVYDLRWADRGSNVLAKGQDGFTPLGPRLAPGSEPPPDHPTLPTLGNGQGLQEANSRDLVFPCALLIAHLSRFLTLEPGDVILAGRPATSRPLAPGEVVEVESDGIGRISNTVVEDEVPLEPIGAMPKVSPEVRAAALGVS